ncbi:hypothetical protein DBZ36_18160 [Alginatibacterium sediminis]|uniref:Uncharacterized protein n=1 Tax=Alginatibacterium sediminis TaxID=2164068 RepID=A0A420E6B9_9ALTE|nr:hypothetical protein [Alginatibacterium sediminis]RKF13696.1 hypothetical protein DBZ36_18160 [Alginatibacterium sediminis]
MNDLVEKLRVVVRAEFALLKSEARRTRSQLVLSGLTIGCVLLAIVALNVGMYFHFTGASVERDAALSVLLINVIIALIPWFLAQRIKPGPEEDILIEIRDKTALSLEKSASDIFSPSKALSLSSPLLGLVMQTFNKTKSKK